MTGWIILGIVVLLLVLLCLLRVGVYVRYEEALLLQLILGPKRLTLIPKPDRPEKKKKEKADASSETPAKEKKKTAKPNLAQIKYSIQVLPGVLKRALGRTGRGILLSPLRVSVVFAGEDPADVAENYGKATALVSALYPELKKLVRIKKARIALSADYEREKMELKAEIGISLRIGTIFAVAFSALFGIIRWLIGYRKLATPREKTEPEEKKREQAQAA